MTQRYFRNWTGVAEIESQSYWKRSRLTCFYISWPHHFPLHGFQIEDYCRNVSTSNETTSGKCQVSICLSQFRRYHYFLQSTRQTYSSCLTVHDIITWRECCIETEHADVLQIPLIILAISFVLGSTESKHQRLALTAHFQNQRKWWNSAQYWVYATSFASLGGASTGRTVLNKILCKGQQQTSDRLFYGEISAFLKP